MVSVAGRFFGNAYFYPSHKGETPLNLARRACVRVCMEDGAIDCCLPASTAWRKKEKKESWPDRRERERERERWRDEKEEVTEWEAEGKRQQLAFT